MNVITLHYFYNQLISVVSVVNTFVNQICGNIISFDIYSFYYYTTTTTLLKSASFLSSVHFPVQPLLCFMQKVYIQLEQERLEVEITTIYAFYIESFIIIVVIVSMITNYNYYYTFDEVVDNTVLYLIS